MENETVTTKDQPTIAPGRYIEGIGRRKTATARVRIMEEKGTKKKPFVVNGKDSAEYFPTEEMQDITLDPLNKMKGTSKFSVSAHVKGGGIHAQAEALRHGLSRALVIFDEELRKRFKKSGLLKRDSRQVERKKFGRRKARKSGQWSKR